MVGPMDHRFWQGQRSVGVRVSEYEPERQRWSLKREYLTSGGVADIQSSEVSQQPCE